MACPPWERETNLPPTSTAAAPARRDTDRRACGGPAPNHSPMDNGAAIPPQRIATVTPWRGNTRRLERARWFSTTASPPILAATDVVCEKMREETDAGGDEALLNSWRARMPRNLACNRMTPRMQRMTLRVR